MSDSIYTHPDNQFVAVMPLRPKLSQPLKLDRTDYRSVLLKLRPPAPKAQPSKRYVDEFSAVQTTHSKKVRSDVKTEPQASYRAPMSRGVFLSVLEASGDPLIEQTRSRFRFRLPKFSKLQYSVLSIAIVFLLAGGYFSFIGWRSVNTAKIQAFKLTTLANQASKGKGSNPALSTTPISHSTLSSYVVAPNLPKYLIIPKLRVDARVLSVGVTSTGALATPDNVFDTAWYDESAEPGQPGAMLIDGHVSSWTSHGVFYGIKTLVAGDIIKVERGDGTIFTYQVVKNAVYSSGNVDMQAAITPVVAGQPGLNLITCTGDVIPGTSTFNERIIVFATLVN